MGTITITVNPTNDAPVATDANVSTNEDVVLDIDLTSLVTDIDDALDLIDVCRDIRRDIASLHCQLGKNFPQWKDAAAVTRKSLSHYA